MIGSLYWIYAFNIVVNSALAFFTSILLIECFIFLFRIKHPRIRVICRIVPFFKIFLDLCLYRFSKWALLHGVNPLLAEKGTRQLTLQINPFTGILFNMKDGKTFSIADVIALSIDPIWIQGIVCVAGLGSICAISLYLKRIFQEKQRVSTLVAEATPILLNNPNPSLIAYMQKNQITVACSHAISSPCLVGKVILFPMQLFVNFSEEEVGAIIAHETAHFRWRDGSSRIACSILSLLFWWIPTQWLQKRIERMQEQAADAAIQQFEIPGIALAGAILKTAQKARGARSEVAIPFLGNKFFLKHRMEMILKESPSRSRRWKIVQYGLLFIALASILFGTLWIF